MDGDGNSKKKSTTQKRKQKKAQSEGHFLASLKTEWSLFWHSLLGDDEVAKSNLKPDSKSISDANIKAEDLSISEKLASLSVTEIKSLTKALSQEKKLINQELEKISLIFEDNLIKIENLSLVGGEFDQFEKENNELNEKGRMLADRLVKVDQRLKAVRKVDHEKRQKELT